MQIEGQRVHGTRLVQTEKYVIAIGVSMVIPDEDPTEPCLEPEAVALLKEVRERAEGRDLAWLRQRGKVYEAVDAA